MSDGYTFTAADGLKYRTTGEFRPPVSGEFYVRPIEWPALERKVDQAICVTPRPQIIVTRVETRYEVTVVLSEEDLELLKKLNSNYLPPFDLLINAIKQGNYCQLDD